MFLYQVPDELRSDVEDSYRVISLEKGINSVHAPPPITILMDEKSNHHAKFIHGCCITLKSNDYKFPPIPCCTIKVWCYNTL